MDPRLRGDDRAVVNPRLHGDDKAVVNPRLRGDHESVARGDEEDRGNAAVGSLRASAPA